MSNAISNGKAGDNQSWEARVVDEIITAENREDEIIREIEYTEHRRFEASFFGGDLSWYDEKLDDLESELSDIQRITGRE